MLNPADAVFAKSLAQILPEGCITAPEPRYLEEPRGRVAGQAGLLARPRSTPEVAEIVRACAAARVGIVPWGGGTGLVGGQVMAEGPAPLILSLERMAALRSIWPDENVMVIEAGATLADAQAKAHDAGRLFPLSIASEGTARIGGVLSTNAGGLAVLRYGNARDLCLGIEAVLPDGSVLHGLKRLRKDNTGYDLRNLLVGAEGTLGVITAAVLRLYPEPAVTGTAMFDVPDAGAALRLLTLAQQRFGGAIAAFELIHREGLAFLKETMPEYRPPVNTGSAWMVLMEASLWPGADPAEEIGALYAQAETAGLVSDGVIAMSAAQAQSFWTLRELLPEANRRVGAIASHDVSLPLGVVPEFLARAGAALAVIGDVRINCFGHLGDGNLHYNLFPQPGRKREEYHALKGKLTRCVHDLVSELGGSFSAEHGVGRLKVGELERYGDPAKLAAMRAIKAALDPQGIMNPGAVLAERVVARE